MVVILRENVVNVGRVGDVVNVSSGFARNFLIPRNLVLVADAGNQKMIDNQRKILEKKRLAQHAQAQEQAEKLSQVTVTISRKVGEGDKLFGSVSSFDIAESLKKQGVEVEKRMIKLENPLKTLGVHSVEITLEQDAHATIKVWVVKEA